jgi:predicted nucleic acid-binding Zn ribbon protein
VGERYKRKPNISCLICDKEIYRRPFEIKKNKGHVFCSTKCYGVFCRKEIPCLVCGKVILAGENKKTCSRSCANIHRKGIKYKLNRPKDKVKSQRSLKIKLLQIKRKKCERCGFKKYQILQIHHKDRNRDNNNVNNIELICPNCHFEEHYLEKSWLKDYY